MKSLFTIQAGEFLVASYIERKFKEFEIWLPSKDTGIDLLLTNSIKNISIQVKYSINYSLTTLNLTYRHSAHAFAWYRLNRNAIIKSKAQVWIFVIYIETIKEYDFIVISPKDLLKKLDAIHGIKLNIDCYFWITEEKKCFETRGLKKTDNIAVSKGTYVSATRDFSKYLNNWNLITKK